MSPAELAEHKAKVRDEKIARMKAKRAEYDAGRASLEAILGDIDPLMGEPEQIDFEDYLQEDANDDQ